MLYLLLVALALVVAYLGYRRGHPPIFITGLMGMAVSLGISDIVIAGILRLYIYRPYLAPTATQDHPLGFFLADYTAVPLLYTGFAALFPRQRWLVCLGLAALLSAMEYGFLIAGVFIHQAWSVWFTFVLFALRFALAAWWVPLLERVGYTPAFRIFLTTVSVAYLGIFWTVWVGSIGRIWAVRPGYLAMSEPDRVLGYSLYHGPPYVLIGSLAVLLGWGRTIRGLLLTYLLLTAYLWWLDGTGMWHRTPGWGPIVEAAGLTTLIGAAAQLDRWFESRLGTQLAHQRP